MIACGRADGRGQPGRCEHWRDESDPLIGEIRRRGVFRIVAAYAVVAWGASLAATSLLPAFGAPPWAARAFIICAVLGLPIAALLAWIYEITTGGIVRDPGAGGDAAVGCRRVRSQATRRCSSGRPTASARAGRMPKAVTSACSSTRFASAGDESCEMRFDDPLISRRHAEIRFEHGRWWVIDLASRNGTRLDGRLVERAPLPPTCSVQLYEAAPAISLELRSGRRSQRVTGRVAIPGVHPVEIALRAERYWLGAGPIEPPLPDTAVLGMIEFRVPAKAGLLEHARRRVALGQRLGRDDDGGIGPARERHELAAHACRKTASFVSGKGEIGELDPAVARRAFERAGADAFTVGDHEIADPGWLEPGLAIEHRGARECLARRLRQVRHLACRRAADGDGNEVHLRPRASASRSRTGQQSRAEPMPFA